jgi:Holliday junction resolvase RusA-like endonuclease
MRQFRFVVPGIPQTAGSKRAIPLMRNGRPICRANGVPIVNVIDDNPKGRAWRSIIVDAARSCISEPLRAPVRLSVIFKMPRPRNHYRVRNGVSILKKNAQIWHTNRPDVTKLARCLEDALTGVAWHDDAQICEQKLLKIYSENPGAEVIIEELA